MNFRRESWKPPFLLTFHHCKNTNTRLRASRGEWVSSKIYLLLVKLFESCNLHLKMISSGRLLLPFKLFLTWVKMKSKIYYLHICCWLCGWSEWDWGVTAMQLRFIPFHVLTVAGVGGGGWSEGCLPSIHCIVRALQDDLITWLHRRLEAHNRTHEAPTIIDW